MSYCPFSCSNYGYMPGCKGSECELTDEAGECLVKQALQCFVQDKREARAAREAFEKTTCANIFDAFFTPKQEPTGAQKLKEMRSDDPVPPRYL